MNEHEYNNIISRIDRLDDKIEKIISGIEPKEEVIHDEECMRITGLSKSRLAHLRSKGEIPFNKPTGGKVSYNRSEILKWVKKDRKKTNRQISSEATTYCVTNKNNKKKKQQERFGSVTAAHCHGVQV